MIPVPSNTRVWLAAGVTDKVLVIRLLEVLKRKR
jgi:heme exporter protein D